jgi:hypothetical protein
MIGREGYMARALGPVDPDDPLAPARGQSLDGLLALLEQLDGVEEAAVVRSALAAGVPRERVLEELQREVERRLARVDLRDSYPR